MDKPKNNTKTSTNKDTISNKTVTKTSVNKDAINNKNITPSSPNKEVTKKTNKSINNKGTVVKNKTNKKTSNNKNVNNPKKSNNNVSKIITILIIILIIGLSIIFSFLALLPKNPNSKYFNKESLSSSEKIYSEILDLTEENYPETPEEVVYLYTESYKLLYGQKIKPKYIDTLLPIILQKQRLLLSEQLINDNTIENQTTKVKESMNILSKNKVKITMIQCNPVIYDQDNPDIAYINVIMQDNSVASDETGKYYFKYYLKRNSTGKWKITGYYPTDKEFNLI